MITSAALTASATSSTSKPAASASGRLLDPGGEADDHATAAVAQVQRVGVALAAVADDRDGLPFERREVGIGVVVHPRRHSFNASSMEPAPRSMTIAPVRTSSLIP